MYPWFVPERFFLAPNNGFEAHLSQEQAGEQATGSGADDYRSLTRFTVGMSDEAIGRIGTDGNSPALLEFSFPVKTSCSSLTSASSV